MGAGGESTAAASGRLAAVGWHRVGAGRGRRAVKPGERRAHPSVVGGARRQVQLDEDRPQMASTVRSEMNRASATARLLRPCSMLVNSAGFVLLAVAFAAVGVSFALGRLGSPPSALERRVLAVVAVAGPVFMGAWALAVPSAITASTAEGLPKLAEAQGRVELSMWMLLAHDHHIPANRA